MPFKFLARELRGNRDGVDSKSKKGVDRKRMGGRGRSLVAPERCPSLADLIQDSPWANMPPELLLDIMNRVEASRTSWPARRDVVSCAAVCKSWRETTKEVVKTPEQCGLLTFPMSLKQPGPRDAPIQCFIKRDRANSVYRLYLGLSPALVGDASKMLLAAKRIRRATNTEFVISFVADDFSRYSDNYVGKLRSNFLGTKFVAYDGQPPHCDQRSPQWKRRLQSKLSFKKFSPRQAVGKYKVATVSYELNVLRTRGPRRMQCSMNSIPTSAVEEGGTAPTPATFENHVVDDDKYSFSSPPNGKGKENEKKKEREAGTGLESSVNVIKDPLVLKNKAPRWHELLQCWCLNFKGRVTVASVKNFQLVASADDKYNISAEEQEKVILQFGKIGKDIFSMDYLYPLSAFQAFAICLSSFDTKPACE